MADEEWITFGDAVKMVSHRLNVKTGEAEALLRAARNEIRTAPDPQRAAAIDARTEFSRIEFSPIHRPCPDVELGSVLDVLRKAAEQAFRESAVAERPLINKADLLSWLDQQAPEKSALKIARPSDIEAVITAVYDDADKGAPRPNINQLPNAVLPRLKNLGYRTSTRRIKEIGGAAKFANRRGQVGKRLT